MKVAIVHYWLVGMRGGEKVVEALCELFPDADIFTHVVDRDKISDTLKAHNISTTFVQRLPRATRWYRRYLPLMPIALEQLDLRDYDLVISSESGPAKGVVVSPEALHVCYCHTPMRYLWDMYYDYLNEAGLVTRALMRPLMHYIRMWDVTSAARVDQFVTNSAYVGKRVRKYYGRDSCVVPPPVETDQFAPTDDLGDFYLLVGQLVSYKRANLAVEAFNRMSKPLVVIGDGEQMSAIKRMAGSHIKLMGWQPAAALKEHYARCRALIFPGLEDFGIVPVEAMASGRPVIAYGRGGVLETVVNGTTGVFFDRQTPEALIDAVELFEQSEDKFKPDRIVQHAHQFNTRFFKERMVRLFDELLAPPVASAPDA